MAVVKNFRSAAGTSNVVYRCASTDGLADVDPRGAANPDRFVFEEAGLILDLRSSGERHEGRAREWIRRANEAAAAATASNATSLGTRRRRRHVRVVGPHGSYGYGDRAIVGGEGNGGLGKTSNPRFVVRIDVLSRSRLVAYVEKHWLPSRGLPGGGLEGKGVENDTAGRSHNWSRIREELNRRGLIGLNEAILECGKGQIREALQIMTLHLEMNPGDTVVVHCVQGKDRTGMVIMLLQSLLEMTDEEIIEDYYLSNKMLNGCANTGEGSAAAAISTRDVGATRGKGEGIFSGTNRWAMVATLESLRRRYGSVSPGYLDSIDFDSSWRSRLVAVLRPRSLL